MKNELSRNFSFLIKFLIIAFLNLPIIIFSQVINGIVTDKKNNPIPYTSIGIVGGNCGTISDEEGNFIIECKDFDANDTLKFSSIGYFTKNFTFQSILNSDYLKVVLEERVYTLNEIIVHPYDKMLEFGRRKSGKNGRVFSVTGKGLKIARLFKNNKKIIIKELQFHIIDTELDSILYRINFYSNSNGLPGQIINNSEILVKSYIKNGWIIKNLEKNNILIENDFFVSLEPLVAWKNSNIDNTGIYELSKMRGKGDYYNSYYSFSGWEKRNIGEMCFYVLAKKY